MRPSSIIFRCCFYLFLICALARTADAENTNVVKVSKIGQTLVQSTTMGFLLPKYCNTNTHPDLDNIIQWGKAQGEPDSEKYVLAAFWFYGAKVVQDSKARKILETIPNDILNLLDQTLYTANLKLESPSSSKDLCDVWTKVLTMGHFLTQNSTEAEVYGQQWDNIEKRVARSNANELQGTPPSANSDRSVLGTGTHSVPQSKPVEIPPPASGQIPTDVQQSQTQKLTAAPGFARPSTEQSVNTPGATDTIGKINALPCSLMTYNDLSRELTNSGQSRPNQLGIQGSEWTREAADALLDKVRSCAPSVNPAQARSALQLLPGTLNSLVQRAETRRDGAATAQRQGLAQERQEQIAREQEYVARVQAEARSQAEARARAAAKREEAAAEVQATGCSAELIKEWGSWDNDSPILKPPQQELVRRAKQCSRERLDGYLAEVRAAQPDAAGLQRLAQIKGSYGNIDLIWQDKNHLYQAIGERQTELEKLYVDNKCKSVVADIRVPPDLADATLVTRDPTLSLNRFLCAAMVHTSDVKISAGPAADTYKVAFAGAYLTFRVQRPSKYLNNSPKTVVVEAMGSDRGEKPADEGVLHYLYGEFGVSFARFLAQ